MHDIVQMNFGKMRRILSTTDSHFFNITMQVIEVQLQAHVKMAQKQKTPKKEEEIVYLSQRRQREKIIKI